MSTQNMPSSVAQTRAQIKTWWRGLAPRERVAVGAGLAALVLFVFWSLFVAPALRTLRTAPAELDRLDTQLEHMQAMATEAKGLRPGPQISTAQAVEALKLATGRLGDKASLNFQGDRATLTLNGVSGDALREWLEEARSAAHARAIDVQLTRGPQGQTGIVVVSLGAGT